jgi:hypothetical protein
MLRLTHRPQLARASMETMMKATKLIGGLGKTRTVIDQRRQVNVLLAKLTE